MYCDNANAELQFIVNVTTGNISGTKHPVVATFPAYTMSKLAGTLYFQYLAQEIEHEKVQILSFHPGLIFNSYWEKLGLGKELFDDG